ncbi:MAG: SAM-dependent chlorinase/fluorinase [Actinomycetota bacterium]|nr:SAM-dependent chlorinase/fluorinase [Actinomycetota bacterium]
MLISVVADYGAGDLAFAEVTQRLLQRLPQATVVPVPVPPFDTVSAGFCVAQLALTPGPPDRVVFHNVAPRADADDPRPDNAGEPLSLARLPGGVAVVGAFAGFVLSFLRDEALSVAVLDVPAAGSQFRSRDIFPDAVAAVVDGSARLGDTVAPERIPAPPADSVVWVDGYGNVKTSWHDAPAPSGTPVRVTIGDVTADATVSDGTFEVPDGALAFAPGSSGWRTRDGRERPFYELLLRGGSAAARFGSPPAGTPVAVAAA